MSVTFIDYDSWKTHNDYEDQLLDRGSSRDPWALPKPLPSSPEWQRINESFKPDAGWADRHEAAQIGNFKPDFPE